jgi:hypothetical protein
MVGFTMDIRDLCSASILASGKEKMAKKVIHKRAEITVDLDTSSTGIAACFPDLNAEPPELPL